MGCMISSSSSAVSSGPCIVYSRTSVREESERVGARGGEEEGGAEGDKQRTTTPSPSGTRSEHVMGFFGVVMSVSGHPPRVE